MSEQVSISDSPTVVLVSDDQVDVITVGIQGPQGTPGVSGGVYTQSFTNNATVVVPHNLGHYPAVTVIDSAGDEVIGDIIHTTINSLTVYFASSFSGSVICN